MKTVKRKFARWRMFLINNQYAVWWIFFYSFIFATRRLRVSLTPSKLVAGAAVDCLPGIPWRRVRMKNTAPWGVRGSHEVRLIKSLLILISEQMGRCMIPAFSRVLRGRRARTRFTVLDFALSFPLQLMQTIKTMSQIIVNRS